ncbi:MULTISPECIES: ABC transporter substrate-binding protein [Alphaproteobacteria]|uniref:ABC transporter substrate-binding protein n=2 Tax=Alphaproteobacteria TaxID=28211 RepID=A0A512HGZ2_9HYPH|nr:MULTISPECIES: extracellular solute-binding protein [Alphaproteobacteria]GEO84723.1 ABC transporter substrate-binding protein [Ciceribacter naphthalenivorans]GLR20656.1 ABC transporter substrate-binding protein [Ciceribacter naphthalenivorans]GLT03512.1 ABC transporter substrate-binding protein [Sphingomonas psychrolutea]
MTALPMNRRHLLQLGAAAAGAALLPRLAVGATMDDWAKPADLEAARREAEIYTTYGMPDTWANYGEVFQRMAQKYGYTSQHVDTDMSSMEEIMKFDAEKNNPVAISSDIGILFGPVADARGVVPPYMPPSAEKLPAGLKGKDGGWVATFTGVPAMVVNTDLIKDVPRSWDDLLRPEFKGKVGAIDASGMGGTDMAMFIAWAYAHGGSVSDLAPGAEFARKLLPQMASAPQNTQTLERGEVPIQLKYDFNCIASAAAMKAKGVNAQVIIPEGTIYAPSATMINRYNVDKMNIAKVFLDFVLSDEAQIAFAKFGARPIRWVLGDLELPAEARASWLPDEDYANVHKIDDWSAINVADLAQYWVEEVTGG